MRSAQILSQIPRSDVCRCRVIDGAILRHFVGVALRPFFNGIHLGAPSAAEDNLRHVPATLQDVSDIQDFEESAANTAASRHRSHQIEIRLRGEAPEEHNRYQEHFAARHERRRADREVEDRNGLGAVEATIGSETDEHWGLRQSDAHDPLERDQFGASLGPFEVGCHTLGECYNARDTDGGRNRFNDGNGERGLA